MKGKMMLLMLALVALSIGVRAQSFGAEGNNSGDGDGGNEDLAPAYVYPPPPVTFPTDIVPPNFYDVNGEDQGTAPPAAYQAYLAWVASGGAGGSGSGSSADDGLTQGPGPKPIADIKAYLAPFKKVAGAVYTVKLDVLQPAPGSRDLTGPARNGSSGSEGRAGHTFLELTEKDPNGTVTTRSVGLYPDAVTYPFVASNANGQLNDNEGHDYNIGLNITIDCYQMAGIINYIEDPANNSKYDLHTWNCTSFAVNALAAGAGISVPTAGDPYYPYQNPGDAGEDIRNMKLSSNMTVVSNPQNSLYTAEPNSN